MMAPRFAKMAMTSAKPERDMKAVCLASSAPCSSERKDRNASTKVPAVLCLKTWRAVLPRCTAAVTSTSCLPVSVAAVVWRMDCMASAEDCWRASSSSLRSPTSPVTLLPAARVQNQQLCSLSFCWPTRVNTRFMWSTFAKRSSMAEPNAAVSSKIARMSVMDLPSTSKSCRRRDMRLMPASTPRNSGSEGEPFSVSSAMVRLWQIASDTVMVRVSDRVYATKAPAEAATKITGTKQITPAFCQIAAGLGAFRSEQRQHLRQQRHIAVQQHTCHTHVKKRPASRGLPKISRLNK
mmetsp:Transcript_121419/g.288504  ORF Transcript_121419/g.288504 Transcript_121419/m.288504 type:complete len:294 (-) Transcript_121419:346-1227(-)